MRTQKIEQVKKRLHSKVNELLHLTGRNPGHVTEAESFADPYDQATQETTRHCHFNSWNREREMMTQLRLAIRRIDAGTFGICGSCGEHIPEKRLLANPTTTLCLACQTRKEKISGWH